jgi:acetyl-CoA carboxylase carboxyltransferase component
VSQGPTQTDAQKHFEQTTADTLDTARRQARDKRHSKGFRTARENLEDLIDRGSFVEYGQLAVAAQRDRRDPASLRIDTAADGVITGTATINSQLCGSSHSNVALAIYDYSVLAGTQGFFHHKKLDRIFEVAERDRLPFIMYTEGGGGRPGDTDVKVNRQSSAHHGKQWVLFCRKRGSFWRG